MQKIGYVIVFLLCNLFCISCKPTKSADESHKAYLEVEGKFLYLDDIQKVIPRNARDSDSIDIAHSYIKKWVTDVLLYENAKRNISNKKEIDDLVEEYRRSLIIHQYEQGVIAERLPKELSNEELKQFYDEYKDQFSLKENIIKGLLLVVPRKAIKLANVRQWIQSGTASALANIEKYSIQNAISYDFFGDKWIPFTQILKRIPLKIADESSFVASHRFVETADSTQIYFLLIQNYKTVGQIEPFEGARNRIQNIILTKKQTDIITNFEEELYNDAIKDETVTFFKEK